MNAGTTMTRWARFDPARPALVHQGVAMTYGELDDQADRVAGALRAAGIERGDRVALHLPNVPAFVSCYLGILRSGAIAVSINPMLTASEVAYLLTDSEARLCFTTEAGQSVLDSCAEAPLLTIVCEGGGALRFDDWIADASRRRPETMAPDDAAAILYTSGTTGRPKGATLSHRNVEWNSWTTMHHERFRPQDRLLLFLPLFHVFGQNAVINAGLTAGCTTVLQRRYVRDDVLEAIRGEGITRLFGVPTVYIDLLAARLEPADLGSVGYEFCAAATLPADVGKRWESAFGRPIFQGYGLTETSPFATYNHDFAPRPGTVGTPVQNVEVRIVDESGAEVDVGAWGEIAIRGPGVMKGYWRRPEDTARAIREGWFSSGDIGVADDDGYIAIVDRVKDMINVSGFKVWPAEVEDVIYSHPAILEAAVYAGPDPVRGERVLASVTMRPDHEVTAGELHEYLRSRLTTYKLPERIEVVERLPKTPTGKILKRELRASAASVSASREPTASA